MSRRLIVSGATSAALWLQETATMALLDELVATAADSTRVN